MEPAKSIGEIKECSSCLQIEDLGSDIWGKAGQILIKHYWSGEIAEEARHASIDLMWNMEFLMMRFSANQEETLNLNFNPDTTKKTIGLWEKDVCEIFICPDPGRPEKYFEFEVSPLGEWLDLAIIQGPEERQTDWEYKSGMRTSARITEGKILMGISIPWEAFGRRPNRGEEWKGNIFRCIGEGKNRGYLAWQPTKTEQPNFHLPNAFGTFIFL